LKLFQESAEYILENAKAGRDSNMNVTAVYAGRSAEV